MRGYETTIVWNSQDILSCRFGVLSACPSWPEGGPLLEGGEGAKTQDETHPRHRPGYATIGKDLRSGYCKNTTTTGAQRNTDQIDSAINNTSRNLGAQILFEP